MRNTYANFGSEHLNVFSESIMCARILSPIHLLERSHDLGFCVSRERGLMDIWSGDQEEEKHLMEKKSKVSNDSAGFRDL